MMIKNEAPAEIVAPPAEPAARRDFSGPAGIYVHIPFCVKKCIYCDFASRPADSAGEITDYFDALYYEIESWDRNGLRDVLPADTVFIGGGTPSAVPAEYIAGVLERLPVPEDAEITMEANPGTLTPEALKVYRDCGINRISLGVQSFQDEELRWLGRIHDADTAAQSVRMVREAGFGNLNLDLMFGFPGQTMESWEATLQRAMQLQPEHVSFYSLQIEEGTPLYDMFREDRVEQLPDEINRAMYHRGIDVLRAHGLELYEISNASRPGYECRHNRKYWTMQPYLGAGAAAHSFLWNCRFANPSGIREYIQAMEESRAQRIAGRPASFPHNVKGREMHCNSDEDSMSDFLFTGLRLREGVSLKEFRDRFGEDLAERRHDAIQRFCASGDLIMENGRLRFTRKGMDITNYILTELM